MCASVHTKVFDCPSLSHEPLPLPLRPLLPPPLGNCPLTQGHHPHLGHNPHLSCYCLPGLLPQTQPRPHGPLLGPLGYRDAMFTKQANLQNATTWLMICRGRSCGSKGPQPGPRLTHHWFLEGSPLSQVPSLSKPVQDSCAPELFSSVPQTPSWTIH